MLSSREKIKIHRKTLDFHFCESQNSKFKTGITAELEILR